MKRHILIILLAALAFLLADPVSAAPSPRPFTGIGAVSLRPGPLTDATLSLYRQPGVGRIATLPWSQLPPLAPVLSPRTGETLAIVMDKRGSWLLITYDAAGRKGWVSMERSWRYLPWKDFLKGRSIRLLPGLKSSWYALYPDRHEQGAGQSATGLELRVVDVHDDWCMVVSAAGLSGWVRWREPDGRFLVSVGTPAGKQNH